MPARQTPERRRPDRRDATDAEAKALASPLRLRILRVCLDGEHTNQEIAAGLGKDPASTLHHVRRLVETGFLAALPVRRGTRGSREIPYRATGKSWTLQDPGASRFMLDAFLEEVALVPAETVNASRLGLRMTDEMYEEFTGRVQALLDEFRDRTDRLDSGAAWSVYFAIHPDPNRPTEPPRPSNRPAARRAGR